MWLGREARGFENTVRWGRVAVSGVALLLAGREFGWVSFETLLPLGFLLVALALLGAPGRWARAESYVVATVAIDVGVSALLTALYRETPTLSFVFCAYVAMSGALRLSFVGSVVNIALLILLSLALRIWLDPPPTADAAITQSLLELIASVLIVAGAAQLHRFSDRVARLAVLKGNVVGDFVEEWLRQILPSVSSITGAGRVLLEWGDGRHVRTLFWNGDACLFDPPRVVEPGEGQASGRSAEMLNPPGVRFRLKEPMDASFDTTHCVGRISLGDWTEDSYPSPTLARIVATRIGEGLDQFVREGELAALAVEGERSRLARDLHDGILQDLTAANLKIRAISESAPDGTRKELEDVSTLLSEQQRRMRTFVRAINPRSEAGDWVFASEFAPLVASLESQWDCRIATEIVPPDLMLPGPLASQIFFIFAEGVANAVQHGKAANLSVRVEKTDALLIVEINDSGRGFPTPAPPRSLRDRVEDLDGQIHVTNTPRGARITVEIPLP
jgi:signal transduction histidine kinase